MRPERNRCEVPPTAGLPLRMADLLAGGDTDLETALAAFLRVPAVQLECSGTAALIVALTALRQMSPGRDEVVLPAYTCALVAWAVAHCGLRARLCDTQPGGLDMDIVSLRSLCGPRTLAVLPTHLCGRIADVAAVCAVAHAVGALVIEDAAQALGARIGEVSVGMQGDIGFYSLAVGKGLTLFEGGVIVARDPLLRAACRIASTRVVKQDVPMEWLRCGQLLAYASLYRPSGLPLAYGTPLRRALSRGDWSQAAGDDLGAPIPLHPVGAWRKSVGVSALARLPAFLAGARARAARRCAQLAEQVPGVTVLRDSAAVANAAGTWPVLAVLLPTRAKRDAFIGRYWGCGWGLGLPFANALPDDARHRPVVPEASPGELPHARDLAGRIMSISNSEWLGDAAFGKLAGLLRAEA